MAAIVQTGFKLAQSVISNGLTTGNEWTNPNNLLLVDGDTADSNLSQAADVIIGNFNFNLPENAVITGIEMQVIGYRGSQTSPPITLTPYAVDNTSGENLYYPYVTPFSGFTTDMDTYLLGGSTYLFATAFTVDQINNLKMQLVSNGALFIDAMLVNVFYYLVSDEEPVIPDPDVCLDCESQIQAQPFYLALPVRATDTGIYVKSFNLPDGTPITTAMIGSCGSPTLDIVMDEGIPKGNGNGYEENARVVDVVPQTNGTVFLDFGSIDNRGLMFTTPYIHDEDLVSEHNVNSKVIISNNAPFYDKILKKCQIDQLVSAPIEVDKEDVPVTTSLHRANYKGAGVFVTPASSDPIHDVDILIPGAGGTTPPEVVTSVSGTSGSTPSDTIELDLPISGLNRGALFQLSTQQGVTVSSILANGSPMTLAVSDTDVGNNLRNEQYFILAPALGTLHIVCTLSADASWSAGAEALAGVNQTDFIGATNSDTGSDFNPTVTLNTTVDYSLVIDGLTTAQTPILYTEGAGQTSNWKETANADLIQGGSSVEPAGLTPDAIISDYSITQSTPWVMTNVEIIGITVAPGTDDHKVMATAADTTPGYLDPKLNIHSSDASVTVTKTITNPGANEIVDYNLQTSGGGGSGEFVAKTFTQTAHGFSKDNIVRSSGVDGQFTKAKADTPDNSENIGIVSTVVSVNSFILLTEGYYTMNTLPAGAVTGDVLFLSDTVAGALTTTEPTDTGTVNKPVAVVINDSTKLIYFHNYRGQENTEGVVGGGTKIAVNSTEINVGASAAETTLYTIPIPAGTLGNNNAIKFRILLKDFHLRNTAGGTATFRMKYGATTISTLQPINNTGASNLTVDAYLEGWIVANNSTISQKGQMTVGWGQTSGGAAAQQPILFSDYGTSAENSANIKNLIITVSTGTDASLSAEAIVVEQITPPSGESNFDVQNVTHFDDFVSAVRDGATTGTTYDHIVSGNFVLTSITGVSFSGNTDHPGIITMTANNTLSGFNYLNKGTLTSNLLDLINAFDIEILAQNVFVGINWQGEYFLNDGGSGIRIHFDDDGKIKYDVGAGEIDTGLTIPTSGTWFKVVFHYDGTMLTLKVNEVVIYSNAIFLNGAFTIDWSVTESTQLTTASLDYVKTYYQVDR